MTWYECWGTYAKTGPYNNVAMTGSPENRSLALDLSQAKNAGYGKGIEFVSENNQIKIHVNLIGTSVSDTMQAILNQGYVSGNWTYDWYADTYVSTNGGASYQVLENNILVARHGSTQALAYKGGWEQSHIDWVKSFTLPTNFTHFKIEVRGDEPAQRHQNIYTREQIITTVKPWAIRKSGVFQSLNRASGFFRIRKNGTWQEKSETENSSIGQTNQGTSRIRKNGTWLGQNKIGKE